MNEAPSVAAGAPKLLELDKKDVEAVRSFLPGKVLGRTAALLALVVLVLGFAGSLDVGLERFLGFPLEPRWLKYTVLIGLPVLIVVAQIVAEWQATRKRKQAQALAVKVDAVPEGYFRIGPYLDTTEDRAKFDRADRIHEKVLAWIERANSTPLYLTGNSGSGKSSVLNAYALPALRAAGWTIVEARAWQDPETALSEAIGALATERKWRLGQAKSLRALLEAVTKRADEKLLVVLDQFAEFVILDEGSERRKAFATVIDDLRAKPISGLKLLLVLRSDYTAAIEELGLPSLRQGENWQEIGRFRIAAATKFMARSGLALQPEALDRIAMSASELDDSPGMIRPITLNVVGHVLSQGRANAPSLDASQLVRHYIEQSVEQPAIRDFAPKVLKELVSDQGTKRPRSEGDLIEQTHLRPGEVRAVMNGLSAAALARPLDAKQGVWELSHDFVARAVGRYLGRRRIDWPTVLRAYAAPALFVVMAAGTAGAILWNAGAEDRLRSQLANFGIDVSTDGLEAATSPRFKAEKWDKAGPLLARMTKLQTLNISHTQITNVAALKGLVALQSLDLSNTKVRDLAPLKGMIALQSLDLQYTEVADLTPLRGMTALQSLDLNSTQVADLAPLEGMTALKSIDLNFTQVADLTPVKDMTALKWLSLEYTSPADLAPLNSLTALQSLDLSNMRVADLPPLKGLTALKWLSLQNTLVRDLGPLRGLTALKSLNLQNTPVTDLEPLASLAALQFLDLPYTRVADLSPLERLTGLLSLSLQSTQVADLAPLKGLTRLLSLNLRYTQVTDLAPLKDLTALKSLDLQNTQASDIAPLKGLTALQVLLLSNTDIPDFTFLQNLPDLRMIYGAPEAELEKLNAYRAQKSLPVIKD